MPASELLEVPVAQLLIRDLDTAVKEGLRMRAAQHGVSMEAEARRILAEAIRPPRPPRIDVVRAHLDPSVGVELELPVRDDLPREIRL
jgi:plasmid stability protein